MAGFHTKTFLKHDDYMTPKMAWENIKEYIPKDKVLWECFYGDGKSGQYLKDMGFDVIHEPIDFFDNNKGEVLISNMPFSKCKKVMKRLKELNKPFIMLLPTPKLHTSYFRELFADDNDPIQIIIPRKRIHFIKKDGKKLTQTNKCNFDCLYYCWKINLPRDIIWLR